MPLMVHSICRAPASHRGQRVRHRQAQIVVAVHADDGAIAQRFAIRPISAPYSLGIE